MSEPDRSPVLVVGVGPGLGLSIARRFGREGRPVALLSRSAERHQGYLNTLREDGVTGISVTADVRDAGALRTAVDEVTGQLGPVGAVYYGPGAADPSDRPLSVEEASASDLRSAMGSFVEPALEVTQLVLPNMLRQGGGTLLFATGVSALVPMPMLGVLGLTSAAVRTYALSLNVALASSGVYAGALVLGGLIRGGRHLPACGGDLRRGSGVSGDRAGCHRRCGVEAGCGA